jgi:hypothetical protein
MKNIITIISIIFLFSCNNSKKNDLKSILDEKIKYRGNLVSGQFMSFNNNDIIGSIKLDTLPKNITLSDFISRNGKQYEIKIIDTEKISIPYTTFLNNVEICCEYDTTSIFTENIGNKKYIIIPQYYKGKEWYDKISYNHIYEVTNSKSNYNKKRIDIDLPMWGLKIGDYIDKDKIDTTIEIETEIEGGRTIRNQFLKSDKSIKISTLEFQNSNKLLITHIEKSDLTETEFNNFIDYIKSKYTFLNIKKSIDDVESRITLNRYTIDYFGLSISFKFTDFNMTISDLKTYSFEISDCYTITKRIIENEGKKFIYNESYKTTQ